jgi:hypothetical protein
MNGLFIVGNKRSGSTHLMRLLNLHENIFVSNESDIIWILYCFHNDKEITNYIHDSPAGMIGSLKVAKSVLNKSLSPKENYVNYQKRLMEKGFLENKPFKKKELKYIGDQKPYQNIDPELMQFTLEIFSDAKFLHILRHPFEVVSSSLLFGNGTGGFIWNNMSPSDILEKWEKHENWVIDAKSTYDLNLLEVRYEKIINQPKNQMAEVFNFLELPYDDKLLNACREITLPNYKKIDQYKLTESQTELLNYYSMKPYFSKFEAQIKPIIRAYFFRSLNKIK